MGMVSWTPYDFMDAHPDLARDFRTFILGRLNPDDYAKNAVEQAHINICQSFNDTAFPMCVKLDDRLFVLPMYYGDQGGTGEDEPHLSNPMRIKTTYAGAS